MSLSTQRSVLSFSRAFNPKPDRGYGPHLSTHLGLLVLRLHLQGCRIRLVPAVDYQDSAEDYKEIWVALRVVFLDDPFISELASHRCHFALGTISGRVDVLRAVAFDDDSISAFLQDRFGYNKVWQFSADTYTMSSTRNTVNAYPQEDFAFALVDARDQCFTLIPLFRRVRLAWCSCEPHMQLHPHPSLQSLPQPARLAHFAAFEQDALDHWIIFDEIDAANMEVDF